MSNDLLFSVIPRTGKVPVKSSAGVTRVSKDGRSDRINEKKREQQEEKNQADQEAVQKRHGKVTDEEIEDKDQLIDEVESTNDKKKGKGLDIYV